jgi:hypothetical protein
MAMDLGNTLESLGTTFGKVWTAVNPPPPAEQPKEALEQRQTPGASITVSKGLEWLPLALVGGVFLLIGFILLKKK